MMRRQTCISIKFGIASHEKSNFLKKVHVRESYDLQSRIRVAEGSLKKKGKQNEMKLCKKIFPQVAKKEGTLGEGPFQQMMPKP